MSRDAQTLAMHEASEATTELLQSADAGRLRREAARVEKLLDKTKRGTVEYASLLGMRAAIRSLSERVVSGQDLREFANKVLRACLATKEGHWIGDKVFISHAWKIAGQGMSLDTFKHHLLAASKAGLVLLAGTDITSELPWRAGKDSMLASGERVYRFIELSYLRK